MSPLFAVPLGIPCAHQEGWTVYDLRVPCSWVTQGQAVYERPVCPTGSRASVCGQGACYAGIGWSTEPRLLEAGSLPEQGHTWHTCTRAHTAQVGDPEPPEPPTAVAPACFRLASRGPSPGRGSGRGLHPVTGSEAEGPGGLATA